MYIKARNITRFRMAQVYRRDHATCQRCGFFPRSLHESSRLEIDHIVPVKRGGSGAVENLQVLCTACNNDKGAR